MPSPVPIRRSSATVSRRTLTWPQPFNTDRALSTLRALAADAHRQPIVFEAQARGGRVTYVVIGA